MNAFGINGWRDPEKVGSPSFDQLLEEGLTRCELCFGTYEIGESCGCEPEQEEAPQAPKESPCSANPTLTFQSDGGTAGSAPCASGH